MVNICTIVTGRTLNAHKAFVDNLAAKINLTEVTLDECDVILEFCPISSRPGTDIDAALGEIPADKPVILVVMHHISDPNHRLYPSSKFVTQSNVFTVDCLFHEAKGFFKSTANNTAVEQTLEHMRKYAKEPPPPAQKLAEKRRPAQESAVRNSPQNPDPAQDVTPTQQKSSKSLREKISDISSTAAENLCAAGISDAQILTLTLPELIELLPGIQNFQTRREIMALISQNCEKSSESLREKISDISSTAAESLRAAGISDARILTLTLPELIELLPRIQNIEGQVTEVLLEQRQVLKGLERQLQAALDTIRPYLELLDKLDKGEELTRTQLCDGNKSLEGVASDGQARSSPHNQNPHDSLVTSPPVQPVKKATSSSSNYNPNPHDLQVDPRSVQPVKKATSSSPNYNPNPHDLQVDPRSVQPVKKATSSSQNYNPNPHDLQVDPRSVQPVKKATSFSPNYNPNLHDLQVDPRSVQLDKKATSSSPNYYPNPLKFSATNPLHSVKVHIVGEIGRNVFLKNLGVRISECNLEQCSVILILCPAATGFEIKAALSNIPGNKEAILVLMHQTLHTFYPRHSMDATRQKGNIVETVNYLLYQSTGELNEQAISRVRSALERYGHE